MKELILIEGVSKDELFLTIRDVVKQVLLCEFETITSLEVMESDRANRYYVRPNRLCGGWDFYMLCYLFKSELSSRKDVVLKAWFQLLDDGSISTLPKGKYYYDMSGGGTDEIFAVASTGIRYGFVEVGDESGAELIEAVAQGKSS